jgi:hypothetical protein
MDNDDVVSMKFSLSPKFQAIIEGARADHLRGASVSAEEARRELDGPHSDDQ